MGVGFWFSRWGFADRQGGFQVQGFGFVGGSEKVVRGPLIVPKSDCCVKGSMAHSRKLLLTVVFLGMDGVDCKSKWS